MTARCELLDAFADGDLGPEGADAFRDHLVECAGCRKRLDALSQLEAVARAAEAEWRRRRARVLARQEQRRRWLIRGSSLAAAAAMIPPLFLAVHWNAGRVRSSDWDAVLPVAEHRTIDGRLSARGADAYREYSAERLGAGAGWDIPYDSIARLERQGEYHVVAAGHAVHGQFEQAVRVLEKAPDSPDRESDRAAITLAAGQAEDALLHVDRALRERPGHPQAMWNRALVLQKLGLSFSAGEAFEAVAKLGEVGWSREAATRALALRGGGRKQREEWAGARRAGESMVAGGPVLPPETARKFPGLSRLFFYDAARAAPSRERVLALLPLAVELDRPSGATVLESYVRAVAAADFRRRRPASAEYASLVARQAPLDAGAAEQLLARLLGAGQPDLWMGALIHTGRLASHVTEYTRVASQRGDPWFLAIARSAQARAEIAAGRLLDAERTLLSAVAACRAEHIDYRCAALEDQLAVLYTDFYRPVEARRHAEAEWHYAQRGNEQGHEIIVLQTLGQIAYFQSNSSLARSYLHEAVLRDEPSHCEVRRFVGMVNAELDMMELNPSAARRSIDATPRCGQPLPLLGNLVLADLARIDGTPAEAATVRADLERLREGRSPGERLYADHIEGRILLGREREAGRRALQSVIARAEKLPRWDFDARRARTDSFRALVADAGEMGHFDRALDLMESEAGVTSRARCLLGVGVDEERATAILRDAHGVIHGHFQVLRAVHGTVPGITPSSLVPGSIRALLGPCDTIGVLAGPPLHGSAELLPPDLAWSYRAGPDAGRGAAPAVNRRVIVADVEPPAFLQLPRVAAWPVTRDGELTVELRGAGATPSRVLAEIEDAASVEFHAHGLVNLGVSDVSHLVLSPDSDGNYALTAGAVRSHRLRGSPLVILGACRAGQTAPYLHQAWSLPVAFIEAGARAVLAATTDVPDAEAGRFFDAVRASIRGGTPVARSLRDERQQWLRSNGNSWTRSVLLFERAGGT